MIKVQNLAKVFGTKHAVDGVSFSVERGEVLGFLGPNGAGKSTTMRMITGFIPPSAGTVTVGGFDIVEHPIEARRLIGYLPENAPAYTDMTVYGFLEFRRGNPRVARRRQEAGGAAGWWRCVSWNRCCTKAWRRFPKATGTAPASPSPSSTTPMCWCWTSRPTAWTRTRNTRSAGSFAGWARRKPSFSRRTSWRRSMPLARGRSSSTAAGSWPTARPQELRQKSEWAGAVTLRVTGINGAALNQKLGQLPAVKRTAIVKEDATSVTARVFPKANVNGALASSIADAAQGWRIEELHTEEGRLDEVFRSITMPDTVTEEKK